MKIDPGSMHWRTRALIDLVVLCVIAFIMHVQGTPAWAQTLLVYIATRPSRLDMAGDFAALQSTTRVKLDAVQDVARKMHEAHTRFAVQVSPGARPKSEDSTLDRAEAALTRVRSAMRSGTEAGRPSLPRELEERSR